MINDFIFYVFALACRQLSEIMHTYTLADGLVLNWDTSCTALYYIVTVIHKDDESKDIPPARVNTTTYTIPSAGICADANLQVTIVIVNDGGSNEPTTSNFRTGKTSSQIYLNRVAPLIILNLVVCYKSKRKCKKYAIKKSQF